MAAKELYASISGVTGIISINVNESHNNSMAIANIICANTTLDIGDHVSIYLGYTDNYDRVFRGYVKMIERTVPNNTYTITLYDDMSRAIDYFIASSTPDTPFSRQNILMQELIRDLLQLAGLAGAGKWDADDTHFVLGISNAIEINLVSVWDYCKTLADAIAWHLWIDADSVVHFKNRKPYPMEPPDGTGQIAWNDDVSENASTPFRLDQSFDISYRESEKELRNRVVVYGANNLVAEAEEESIWLPTGFRKSVVAAFQFIDDQGLAQDAADYNLNLLHRLTKDITLSIEGDPSYGARKVYTIDQTFYNTVINEGAYSTNKNWYAYTVEHNWSSRGYLVNFSLHRGIGG